MYFAVGASQRKQISFVKSFDDSSFDASNEGPNVNIPALFNISETPQESGSSGPIITRSTLLSWHQLFTTFPSLMFISMQFAIFAIPAFPGEQVSFAHLGFCFIAHAIECSRPPPPNISICKKVSLAL